MLNSTEHEIIMLINVKIFNICKYDKKEEKFLFFDILVFMSS